MKIKRSGTYNTSEICYISGIRTTYSSYTLVETKRRIVARHAERIRRLFKKQHYKTILYFIAVNLHCCRYHSLTICTLSRLTAFQADSVSPSKSYNAKRFTKFMYNIHKNTHSFWLMPTPKPFLQFNGELSGSGSIIEHKSVAAVHCVRPPPRREHRIRIYFVYIYIYICLSR